MPACASRCSSRAIAWAGCGCTTPKVEADPLGQQGSRIHTSLYASLKTNLPRDIMAFDDYTFDSAGGGADDWPRFPDHTCVLTYLERFAAHFALLPHIHFNAQVTSVAPTADAWRLNVTHEGKESQLSFDAVAVCSGHFSDPRVPSLAGAAAFPGRQIHSHNYREPSGFRDRRVAVFGTSASGLDLSREIGGVAQSVHWCGEMFNELPPAHRQDGALSRWPSIERLTGDGEIVTRGGLTAAVDDVVYCTGYHYRYPFMDAALLTIDDNWVQPLYHDLVHIDRPTLGFIGIPFRVLPFAVFETQARWFTALLGGAFRLPSPDAMRARTASYIAALRTRGVKQRHFHQRTIDCFDYLDSLCDEAGIDRAPQWRRQTAAALLDAIERSRGNARGILLPHFAPTVVPPESIAGAPAPADR
ncbi:MAG: NAD(P)-binding domain-containing protein [Gammaproteobacteria bacterium]|nr:NAD(P)-binding domain-containing protein [Gammaproteobacteria bacterium]